MVCRNCGFHATDDSLFCTNCGFKFENTNIQNNNEDLVRAYIGKNADKFLYSKPGQFSFYPLLFGVFYLIYRKMYFYAVIWYVLALIISLFLPTYAEPISLFLNIVVCGLVNKLYVKQAYEKVEEIKQANIGMPYGQLREIVAEKGGTCKMIILIPITIVCLITILTPIIIGMS